ncbi:golgin subfamily A member 6-like protein 22 [Anneissia japonica]|uniref:golgin subfamily A member 6-like protein 22 n=1 Tax=Anneissia japonica TaxID=1529436 RepID=UPI0014259EFE|nr:golgin subfamily A member 6-like protein 22 [Anneissia japonica]
MYLLFLDEINFQARYVEVLGDGVVDVNSDIIQVLYFTTVVSHDVLNSNTGAFEVSIVDYVDGFVVDYFDEFVPAFGTVGLIVTVSSLSYTSSSLKVGENITLSYKAYFNADTLSRDGENLYLPVTVKWKTLSKSHLKPLFSGTQHGPIQDSICVQIIANYDSSEPVTKHGLAALAFFICVLIAVIFVVIVAILCIQFCYIGPYSIVQPVERGQTRGLLIDSNLAGKTIACSYEESSLVSVNESIVMILILEQSSKKYIEFDNLDILNTITLDVELEEQRVEAMAKSFELLIQKWAQKKEIAKEVDSKVGMEFQRRLKDLTKKMNSELRRDSLLLRKQLTAMNSIKLIQLQKKQKKENQKAFDDTMSLHDGHGQSDIMQLLQQQHQAETEKLLFMLKLQQDENQEVLRKEYAIQKRIGIRSIQQECLDEVITQGNLNEEQARELITDHWQNMAVMEVRMDEEISKQRMFLEEQFERHKVLVARNVSQEEHHKGILNMMVKQTVGVLYQLHEDDRLNKEEVRQYVDKFQNEVVVAKDKYEQEKKKQEKHLHTRMSALKKQKLREKVKDNNSKLEEFENEQKKKQANGKFESSEYLDSKLTLFSKHKLKLKDTENELDKEAARKLEELREKLRENMEETIEKTRNHLYSDLKSKGLTKKMKDEILEEHQEKRDQLRKERDKRKTKQEEEIKKRLAEKRKIWVNRKADERYEQMQIREHESKMVGKLLAAQLVMSEIDRYKIMQEHKKLMVKLENNLTLNKLHQRRKMEEKIEVRRATEMEKLERQQQQEKRRLLRSKQLGSDNEDDREESQMMMIKHAEQRLALLSSEKPQAEDDFDNIRVEMLHERSRELKKQEEKLGSMIVELQMEKAREMATIQEQQKALMQLKISILDDMTERDIIQNLQSKKIIENYRKEIRQLEGKLNDAREKQEKEFKKKLKEMQVEREKAFLQEQEISLQKIVEKDANSTKARLKKVAVKHKQTIELENFRQTLQVEIRQSLEDLRRRFEIKQLKAIQDQVTC